MWMAVERIAAAEDYPDDERAIWHTFDSRDLIFVNYLDEPYIWLAFALQDLTFENYLDEAYMYLTRKIWYL